MKNMIFFSQAPADIKYVLSLYNKNYHKYNIKIIVVNVENSYKYLKSLNLHSQVEFVPLVGQKHLLKFLTHLVKLRFIYKKIFADVHDSEVYFFSKHYDYVTAFFIEKLTKNNNVYFNDIYKIDMTEVKSIKNTLQIFFTKVLLGINIKFFNLSGLNVYRYAYDENIVKELHLDVKEEDLASYKCHIHKEPNDKKNLLLFESNDVLNKRFVNYEKDLANVMEKIEPIFNIYIKPHPRLGYSKILDNYNIEVVEGYIPSEMLSLDDFSAIVGVSSASLATAVHEHIYSIINMFEFRDTDTKKYYIDYLDNLSKGKIVFVDDIHGIK